MRKISSNLTEFYRKKFLICQILIFIVLLSIFFLKDLPIEFLILTLFIFFLFFFIWFWQMKDLKIVYLKNKTLIVDNEIIQFEKIISIEKSIFSPNYKVKYFEENKKKSFIFLPVFTLPFFTQSFIKEIRRGMQNK